MIIVYASNSVSQDRDEAKTRAKIATKTRHLPRRAPRAAAKTETNSQGAVQDQDEPRSVRLTRDQNQDRDGRPTRTADHAQQIEANSNPRRTQDLAHPINGRPSPRPRPLTESNRRPRRRRHGKRIKPFPSPISARCQRETKEVLGC